MLVGASVAAAAPLASTTASRVAPAPVPADPTKPYKALLHIDGRISRLRRRWARLEAYLDDQPPPLPGAEPVGARELRDIEGMLALLMEQRAALLETLPAKGAATFEEVIARLAVAERLIWSDDHLEAHAMIAGSRQDLMALLGESRPSPR
jgi:hypothetical protein